MSLREKFPICGRELTYVCHTVNDADYRSSKNDWDTFVEALTEKIIEKDDTIPELPPKDLVSDLLYATNNLTSQPPLQYADEKLMEPDISNLQRHPIQS